MRRLLITKKRGGLWARLTALMVVLMMTTMQINAQTVEVDGSSSYTPTQIVNGNFNVRPFEAFKYNNVVYTSLPTGIPEGRLVTEVYPNGVNGGWNTSENRIFQGGLFEYYNGTETFGLTCHNYYYIEMNANNSAVLSQDLTTKGGDVILWTLKHAARHNYGDYTQRMRVDIGAPIMDGGKIVAAVGINNNIDAKIVASTLVTYKVTGVTNPEGATYGYAKTAELAGLEVNKGQPTNCDAWKDARGVYVIPEGQTVTRFAFTAYDMKTPDGGNLLDDITFSTIIGNLQASVSDVGDVIIKGYWGDADANKKLCVKIGTTVHQINMSGVLNNNFKITFPRTMIGSNTQVDIYHQDYEQAKVRLQFAIKVCTVGTGSSMMYYSSLNEAISNASNGQTVNMIADATENVTVPDGKTITLNLNGNVLTASSTSATAITNNGTLTLTDTAGGGKVTGGATGVQQNGTLTVGGKLNITGNTTNLYLPTGKNVAVSSLASGASIGVTTQSTPTDGNPVEIVSNGTSADAQYFKSDNTNYKAIYDGSTVKLSVMEECYSWAEVKANLEAGKNVKLMADVTQDFDAIATLEGTQNVTLDLNGHTLTQVVNPETAEYIIQCRTGSAKVTIKDSGSSGAIVGNSSQTTSAGMGGGGFYFAGSSSLTLESGTLRNFRLTASGKNGGCICIDSSTASFTMTGGTIENCTATGKGGAVYSTNGNITVGGTAKITGNTVGGTANNVYLPTGKTITVGTGDKALTSGASIGVTTETAPTIGNPVNVTSNGTFADMQYFHSDNDAYRVIFENNDASPAVPVVKLAIPVCMVGDGESAVYYSSVSKALEHIEAGETATIKLLENTTENVAITDENITLDLNGKTITATSGNAITVSGGTLTINDPGDTGGVTGNIAINGGETTINNGTFTGPIAKDDDATLQLEGGKYGTDPTPFLRPEQAAKPVGEYYEIVTDPESIICSDGTHSFTSLKHAIEYNNGKSENVSITLSNDTNEDPITIASGQDITLDLNGKTITSAKGNTNITNNGTLKVIDSSEEKTGAITGASTGAGIDNKGTLNLYAGNITGNAAGVDNNGILTLGGTTKITLNGPVEARKDLYLPNEKTFTIATGDHAPAETMLVGITTQTAPSSGTDITLTGENGNDYSQHFFGDDSRYSVINTENNVLKLTNEVKVLISAEPIDGGEIQLLYTATGEPVEEPEHILYGKRVTITATPSGDYAFAGWYDKDSGLLFSKTPTFTFDAIRDYNLEARFTDSVIWVKVKKGN